MGNGLLDKGAGTAASDFFRVRKGLRWLLMLAVFFGAVPSAGVAELSLRAQIGQMLLVGFHGLNVEDGHPILEDIARRHLGGVVLFDYDGATRSYRRNIASPAQVRKLVADLQQAAPRPLLVAIDQEGGQVARLKVRHGFPPTVAAQALGGANDVQRTRREAAAIAETLAQLGINLNLAPVVDLDVNPDNPVIGGLGRSFGADPQLVANQARTFIEAHHGVGVLCSLKHFPGHGSSATDSHLGLPDVSRSWTEQELRPFAVLIDAGVVDAVMTGHLFNDRLDPKQPATLSSKVINGVLRGQLGYQGVVISDDLQMGAISERHGLEEALELAIAAGVDLLLIADPAPGAVARAIDHIARRVAEGGISPERIEASWQRIRRLKQRLGDAAL